MHTCELCSKPTPHIYIVLSATVGKKLTCGDCYREWNPVDEMDCSEPDYSYVSAATSDRVQARWEQGRM